MTRNDKELYERWKRSGLENDLEDIIDAMEGIIYTAVMKYSAGYMPSETLTIKGRQLAAEAIRSFNPSSGTKLSSWITTWLEKLQRYYAQNGLIHISEDMFNTQTKYYNSKNLLVGQLDRDPTVSELADYMGIPEKKILSMEKVFSPSYNDSVLSTNKFMGVGVSVDEDDLLYAYRQLSEQEQRLFKLKTGWPSGKPGTLSSMSIKTGMSKPTLSRELNSIADKIKYILGL